MFDPIARAVQDKIRVHFPDPFTLLVFLQEREDLQDPPCKCCAFECGEELTVSLTFCGMTVTETIPIPGQIEFPGGQAVLPDGSFIILGASIVCDVCHWVVNVSVCAYCDATQEFASDSFEAFVPFAASPYEFNRYCPQTGVVELECFGDQFGIPCVTAPTVSIGLP